MSGVMGRQLQWTAWGVQRILHLGGLLLIDLVLLRIVSQFLCDLHPAQQASPLLVECMGGQAASHQGALPKNALAA